MANAQPYRVKTIKQYHQLTGLPKPEHPLISVINLETIKQLPVGESISLVYDFYCISLKRVSNAKYKYGQQEYDFDEGVLYFLSPNQVLSIEFKKGPQLKPSGWLIFIHPDFLWNTPLAKKIKQYKYFDYEVNEALYLSPKEEKQIINIIKSIQQEYRSNIDKFSQDIIISQLEVLLNYSERFYQRQFITRKITNHKILDRLESILTTYFNSDDLEEKGLPTVQYIAEALNISPGYLSSLLTTLTGQNTQQHIHDKLIEKAKEKLSTTDLSVSEIAYKLGFEYTQSFSRLFKTKTKLSPLAFRQSFN
ncbi:helix-turn-helix domain-containing protein [Chitinophaga oryziterrae]|uniref:Helix-turn-helix domain-containing protein n=1 Tax=Chitinophaga oryziterrae TaxID=1031224 RepID=A0A6N8JCZ4_9BACT|nr:helix-turn-helix domain-containing protein [Chitinophaga oryziterrae]MVT42139.1 helix-turn-helix domain-containing protein [Chitinophaga oryziterrae]